MRKECATKNERSHASFGRAVLQPDTLYKQVVAAVCHATETSVGCHHAYADEGEAVNQVWVAKTQGGYVVQTAQKRGAQRPGGDCDAEDRND